MKRMLFAVWAVAGLMATSRAQVKKDTEIRKSIVVEISPNVELLGFVYFLGYQGNEIALHDQSFEINHHKTNGKEWFAFGWRLYNEYKPFEKNKNLQIAAGVAGKIWLDYLINLLIQLDNFPNAKLPDNIAEKYYIRFSEKGNEQEARVNVKIFIDALNHLYQEVKFNDYLTKYEPYYHIVLKQINQGLPGSKFLPAMESFYKRQFGSYHLIPSLTIPTSMGFGVSYEQNNEVVVSNVFGPLWFQHLEEINNPDLGFSDKRRIRELSTHEFGHSFVNRVIDSLPQRLIEESKPLFDSIKNVMSEQGYAEWKICLYEHFVRAGEIIIARNTGYLPEAENLLKEYVETRKFIYLPIIIKVLEDYNKNANSSYKSYVIEALYEMKQAYIERAPVSRQK